MEERALSRLLEDPCNQVCADCDAKDPQWASVNLGAFICINCAGIHRAAGVSNSIVKSVKLDKWDPHEIEGMKGNSKVNQTYPDPSGLQKLHSQSSTSERTAWIHAKYRFRRTTTAPLVQPHGGTNAMTEYAGVLTIRLYGGRNLVAKDVNGTSDPYVKCRCGKQEVISKVVENSLSPYWDDTLTLCIPSLNDTLHIEVWDKDVASSDDFMGSADICLAELSHQTKPKKQWVKLQQVKHGEIHLKLSYAQLDH